MILNVLFGGNGLIREILRDKKLEKSKAKLDFGKIIQVESVHSLQVKKVDGEKYAEKCEGRLLVEGTDIDFASVRNDDNQRYRPIFRDELSQLISKLTI